ncbi:L,D-transpeptidase family protein [Sulfurimonas sp. SAG-AH-194-I05]|nr:L,D-transpeptidase family protein [Sulfurimonas sp. SAG-AH-194-I05]MDF1874960.1 L,D-transpeptidase family protein [Sulfurimonas sp. SAG-AH-194-I05]
MIKSFLSIIIISTIVYAQQQVILVVADDFNTSKAKLECYEGSTKVFETIDVTLGKKGLGWGLGISEMSKKVTEPIKKEGDKKAPIGIFKLTKLFGYSKSSTFHMPYLHATKELICVDDSNSNTYNQIIHMPKTQPQSFEYMKRNDLQYEFGVVVEHNKKAKYKAGSCIFLHIQKNPHAGTAGCTAMTRQNILKIMHWLDIKKNPILIQVPRSKAAQILKMHPELQNSALLK